MRNSHRIYRLLGALLLLPGVAAAQPWTPAGGLVLQGDLVTMNGALEVIPNGRLVIVGERIAAVLRPGEAPPDTLDLSGAVTVQTGGWIFPGLIDSHNHVTYNVLPLYPVPERYTNRYQWTRPGSYRRHVNGPEKLLTERSYYGLATEAVKYAEVKALVGGVTSLQGSPDLVGTRMLVRNLEHFNFGQDRIYQRTLAISDTRFDPQGLLRLMEEERMDAWLVHLSEGTDSASRAEFARLRSLGLLGDRTVLIHGTALTAPDFAEMAAAGTKLVWSPLSNLLLYGETTNVPAALAAGVMVALGTDWSPSGSKNLLGELKVADGVDRTRFGGVISDTLLVEMVTRAPAFALGLDDKIGQLLPGHYADVAVFEKVSPDPYRSLIESNERHVRLVLIGGDPRYGDRDLMERLKPGHHEILVADGVDKGIDVTDPRMPGGEQSFEEIRQRLEQALLFDREHMWVTFGGAMERDEFDPWFDQRFPAGVVATPLDPVYAFGDTAYFAAIGRSGNAALAFDLASFWTPGSRLLAVEPVVAFVNGAAATFERLDVEVALDRRAAERIVARRDGPDGRRGTGDDRPFLDREELLAVPYVGRSALEKIERYVLGTLGSDVRVLAFLNSAEATLEVLNRAVGLRRNSAEAIVRHRHGPDGRFGTGDDDVFDTMEEVDAVLLVGPVSLVRLRRYVSAR